MSAHYYKIESFPDFTGQEDSIEASGEVEVLTNEDTLKVFVSVERGSNEWSLLCHKRTNGWKCVKDGPLDFDKRVIEDRLGVVMEEITHEQYVDM